MDAKTAFNQLTQSENGVNRLVMMVGASAFGMPSRETVSFKFSMHPTLKKCSITLDANDLYTMAFYGRTGNTLLSVPGLYADMLKSEFEQTTKLYLTL